MVKPLKMLLVGGSSHESLVGNNPGEFASPTMWGPQTLCLLVYDSPSNYGYNYHKPKREIVVMFTNWTLSTGGSTWLISEIRCFLEIPLQGSSLWVFFDQPGSNKPQAAPSGCLIGKILLKSIESWQLGEYLPDFHQPWFINPGLTLAIINHYLTMIYY